MVGEGSNGLDDAPAPLDHEGRPLECHVCQVQQKAEAVQCRLGHACARDRYAPRIWRFFRQNPAQAAAWLRHPYFETRAIAAHYANEFVLTPLLNDPDEAVRRVVAERLPRRALRRLINDPHREVRIRVAQRLQPSELHELCHDPDYYVRLVVA